MLSDSLNTEPMNSDEFRIWGKKMVDYVADYWDSLRERKPIHDVKPGYILDLVPNEPPENPESWDEVFQDIEKVVLSSNTHWGHPHFFAYYPTACSYPAIVADILSGGISCIGFTWNSSPSCTELEMVMLDWLAKMLALPEYFLNSDPGFGGGIIQGTASEATYVALLAARNAALKKFKEENSGNIVFIKNWSRMAWSSLFKMFKRDSSDTVDSVMYPRLVAYCSDQSHSSVEKAGLLGAVVTRKLKTYKIDNYALNGFTLETAIKQDINQGLTPFFYPQLKLVFAQPLIGAVDTVCATVGATTCCAVDDVKSIGEICQKYGIWFHIDAAYAGGAAVCPEYRYLLDGIEFADSFNYNPHKWQMINFDCSAMWFRDVRQVEQSFLVDPLYLKHEHQKSAVPDYRNWQIPLGRRFRSLKIWFVLRSIGVSGLQKNIRKQCALAKEFGDMVEIDERFELVVPVNLGLVCFRLKGENELSEQLLKSLNEDRRIHLVPSKIEETYFLRLCICSTKTESDDVKFAWDVIKELAEPIVQQN